MAIPAKARPRRTIDKTITFIVPLFITNLEKILVQLKNLIDDYRLVPALLCIWFLVLCLIAVYTDGTGGSGDSIQHYLFSRYAFAHPEIFLDHWAKPFFVLLSAPFAAFGFTGMKIFNCLVAILTGYFTFKTAKLLKIENTPLVLPLLFFAPLYFILTFSGLTEPLFALILIIGLNMLLAEKTLHASLVLSLLPFIRSEGLIILGVIAFYLIIKRHYKYVPILLTGHLLYGIAGIFYYQDLLWVFNKIPYAHMTSPYGSGDLFAFFSKMNYTIGIPIYMLLSIGVLGMFASFFRKSLRLETSLYQEKLILIYGGFAVFFIAHSLFWYLGIFNSMGLKRVLIAIMPLIAIIALNGYNLITHEKLIKNSRLNIGLKIILIVAVIGFPFTSNPAAVNWKKDLSPDVGQILVLDVAQFVSSNFPNQKLYYSHPYFSVVLGIDHFNTEIHEELRDMENANNLPAGSLIMWDDWFSVNQSGIGLEKLQSFEELEEVGRFDNEKYGRKSSIVVFKKLN